MRHLILNLIFILFIPNLTAQIYISGRITDCEKNNLIGVTIREKDTGNGTINDFEGQYHITVADTNSVLEFSYVGCITEYVKVGDKTTINVILKEDKKAKKDIVITGKPIIYLYPETGIDILVQFQYNGKLAITYPEYNNGWNIHALPNGTLYNKTDNKEYSYLFWDGERKYKSIETMYSNGFIVSKDSAALFLQSILPKVGLKPNEYNEFIVYWLPFLKENDWNFVYFRTGDEYNLISKNLVTPKPETEIRVFMEFKKIEKPFKVKPQLFEPQSRKGFTLVEWGGSLLKDSISVKNENGEFITR